MPKTTLSDLKLRFKTGARPTGSDFVNLIDTLEDATALAEEANSRITLDSTIQASLQAEITSRISALSTKAEQSAVDSLATLVATKANQSSIDSLSSAITAKAEQSALDFVSLSLSTKADKTDISNFVTSSQVDSRLSTLIGTAPANLDTLGEIATKLSSDESLASALTTTVSSKASQSSVDSLSSSVATKADQSTVDSLATVLLSKANQSSLNTLSSTVSSLVTGVSSVAGRTGAITLTANDVNLGNINNTSDINKPISNAVSIALSSKADSSTVTAAINQEKQDRISSDNTLEGMINLEISNRIASDAAILNELHLISGSTPINRTYSELLSLQGAFTPGASYRITDFRTRHLIYNTSTFCEGPVEPLVVTAVSSNSLSIIATSEEFPQDIIYYKLVADSIFQSGEYDRGIIFFRNDTIKDIQMWEDWRAVKSRRWSKGPVFIVVGESQSGTNRPEFLSTSIVSEATFQFRVEIESPTTFRWKKGWNLDDGNPWLGSLPISVNPQTIANGILIKFGDTTGQVVGDCWALTCEGNHFGIYDTDLGFGYIDVLPINNSRDPQKSKMISVGSNYEPKPSNIVIGAEYDVTSAELSNYGIELGPYCKDMTFGRNVNCIWVKGTYGDLEIQRESTHIEIGMCGDGTIIGERCSAINIGQNSARTIIESNVSNVMVEDNLVDTHIYSSNTSYGAIKNESRLLLNSTMRISDSLNDNNILRIQTGDQGIINGAISLQANNFYFDGIGDSPSVNFTGLSKIHGVFHKSIIDLGSISGTAYIDVLSGGTLVKCSLIGTVIFQIGNLPSALTLSTEILLFITSNDETVVWPSGTIWPNGTSPSLSVSGTDIISLTTIDGGASFFGKVVSQGY